MTNVSKGDLAIIVNAATTKNNNRIVEVVEYYGFGNNFSYDGMKYICENACHCWLIKGINGPLYFTNFHTDIVYESGEMRLFGDAYLRRIAGPSVVTETETDQPAEVTA